MISFPIKGPLKLNRNFMMSEYDVIDSSGRVLMIIPYQVDPHMISVLIDVVNTSFNELCEVKDGPSTN